MSNPDLNPTPEAIAAVAIWNHSYASQRLGSMGFFNSLSVGQKKIARNCAQRIIDASKTHGDITARQI